MRNIIGAYLAFAIVFTGFHAQAEEAAVRKYDGMQDIPSVFQMELRPGMMEDRFMQRALAQFTRVADGKDSFSKADLDAGLKEAAQQEAARELQHLIAFDANRDTRVTKDEILKALREQMKERRRGSKQVGDEQLGRYADEMIKHKDEDGDGAWSYQEMGAVSERHEVQAKGAMKEQYQYLELDPNADGTLTRAEFEAVAKASFAVIDADNNGKIEMEEFAKKMGGARGAGHIPPYIRYAHSSDDRFPDCRFKGMEMPKDFHLFGAGGKARPTGKFIEANSGHEAHQMDIIVNKTDKPVGLVLSNYEPTIWSIRKTPETKIFGVLVSGYHKQVVTGLDKSVPMLNSSYDEKGPCDHFTWTSEDAGAKAKQTVRIVFKKPVELLFVSKDSEKAEIVVGDPPGEKASLQASGDSSADSVAIKDSQLPGKAGLKQAEDNGILRAATQADLDAWAKLVSKEGEDDPRYANLPPIAGEENMPRKKNATITPRPGATYVVLKDFTFPGGLYGGNAAVFIVPKGVAVPLGETGHSLVYDMNTAQCLGIICQHGR